MSACRRRSILNEDWRCDRRALIGGCCFEHMLEWCRFASGPGRIRWTLDLGNCNRPIFRWDKDTKPPSFWSLAWGAPGCDPTWEICYEPERPGTEEEP